MNLIKNEEQASKTIAGNNFQALVAYLLMKNVKAKNLPDLKVDLKTKNHPLIEKYATIYVDEDTQKPDVDIIIYQDKENTPIFIISCKTSLRERAGQTYKWKLLLDFATCNCEYMNNNERCPINKYQLRYKKDRTIYVAFVTADFYNEVNNPQQQGIFIFFDFA